MSLEDLYQEEILDHSKNPHNFYKLEGATHMAEGYNPLCGDKVSIYLKVIEGKVSEASFQGVGCAISKASASILTETIKGKSLADARDLVAGFCDCLIDKDCSNTECKARLITSSIEPLLGIKSYPTRIKCATLAWRTFESAVKQPFGNSAVPINSKASKSS